MPSQSPTRRGSRSRRTGAAGRTRGRTFLKSQTATPAMTMMPTTAPATMPMTPPVPRLDDPPPLSAALDADGRAEDELELDAAEPETMTIVVEVRSEVVTAEADEVVCRERGGVSSLDLSSPRTGGCEGRGAHGLGRCRRCLGSCRGGDKGGQHSAPGPKRLRVDGEARQGPLVQAVPGCRAARSTSLNCQRAHPKRPAASCGCPRPRPNRAAGTRLDACVLRVRRGRSTGGLGAAPGGRRAGRSGAGSRGSL